MATIALTAAHNATRQRSGRLLLSLARLLAVGSKPVSYASPTLVLEETLGSTGDIRRLWRLAFKPTCTVILPLALSRKPKITNPRSGFGERPQAKGEKARGDGTAVVAVQARVKARKFSPKVANKDRFDFLSKELCQRRRCWLMFRGFTTKQRALQSSSGDAIGGATTYLNFRRRKWNMNKNQNASKRQRINQESSKHGVVIERQAKETTQENSPKKFTLLKANNWLRHTSTKHEQSLAHGYYQEPCPAHFDGVSGLNTKALTEAFIKSMCPNWVRIYVTIQYQGKPRLEFAHRVLHEAAILRDKSLIGPNFNRSSNARYRTMDWFFEEQGAGANCGNRHCHGIVIIAPDHPKLQEVEKAITNAVIEGMVRHLTKSQSPNANANHHSKLVNRQNAKSGKVVLAERCLNAASCLGYSMKQFDIWKEHFASMDYMPKEQLKRIGIINKDAVTNFIEALPDPPLYVRRLSALEREAQSTPHPRGAWM